MAVTVFMQMKHLPHWQKFSKKQVALKAFAGYIIYKEVLPFQEKFIMIKCAVIGCGVISGTHISGFQKLDGVEVVKVCDLIRKRAKEKAEKFNIPEYCTDYREILQDDRIDAVSICTDHASHAQIFIDAVNAGKHVICEKVPGRTPEDLEAMVSAAESRKDLVITGIFQHRFAPGNIALKKLVEEGKFGKLLFVNLNFNCLRTREYYEKDPWRGTIAGEGGGVLINQAIHFLDQLRFLFGNVKQLVSRCANLGHHGIIETEDTANFIAEFENGLMINVSATNASSARWRSSLCISGDKVLAEFIDEKLAGLQCSDEALEKDIRAALEEKSDEKVIGKSYYGVGHTAQLADFTDAIREKRPAKVAFADAANSAAFVQCVYKSNASGTWEKVKNFS